MSASTSRQSYLDCFTYLDRALDAPHGIRIKLGAVEDPKIPGLAHQLRVRLNYARKLDRAEAEKIYPRDHPEYGVSAYDALVFRIVQYDDVTYVQIEPRKVPATVEVEDLPGEESAP